MSDSLGEDSFCLEMDTHTKFSVWVSFCEIYNENIHDLLESLPHGAQRRPVLRLSQDIKGNSLIKGAPSIHTRKASSSCPSCLCGMFWN